MNITLDNLVTHRFRGFDTQENSLAGLRAALTFGVKHLEFDIRVAACGTPMIYHDEYAYDGEGHKRMLCNVKASDFNAVGGDFARFPTFEQLLKTIVGSGNKDAHFLIDIKDAGFEVQITALVRLYRLHKRVSYVSWLPEALYACHALEPNAPLCLSHWCQKPNASIRKKHQVYTAVKGDVPRSNKRLMHGERSGWFVDGVVTGEMRELLRRTRGSICVPVDMVSAPLVAQYHALGIIVSVFSYIDLDSAKTDQNLMGIDLYFIDNKKVFDAL